jgi:parvulin-like peptidyl-prolyl isomerase
LLHFFALGAGLFALSAILQGPVAEAPNRIHVDAAQIRQIEQGFERTWQRPPTRQELEGLVDEFVREEIYYREALAMGLDRDDTIVRRRMRQKLEFLSNDLAPPSEPDDAALERHLAAHADAHRIEPRVALRQVFVSRDRRGDAAVDEARALLARLPLDPGAAAAGDPSMLPASLALAPLGEVRRVFGDDFAAAVARVEPGRWTGPIESGFGLHLVFVERREEGRLPTLAEVRDAVRADWESARRTEANEAFYRRLRERYQVTVDAREP